MTSMTGFYMEYKTGLKWVKNLCCDCLFCISCNARCLWLPWECYDLDSGMQRVNIKSKSFDWNCIYGGAPHAQL